MPQNDQDKGILSYLNTEENSMALSLMSSGYADYEKGGIGLITGIFKLLVGSIMAFFSVGPSNVSKIIEESKKLASKDSLQIIGEAADIISQDEFADLIKNNQKAIETVVATTLPESIKAIEEKAKESNPEAVTFAKTLVSIASENNKEIASVMRMVQTDSLKATREVLGIVEDNATLKQYIIDNKASITEYLEMQLSNSLRKVFSDVIYEDKAMLGVELSNEIRKLTDKTANLDDNINKLLKDEVILEAISNHERIDLKLLKSAFNLDEEVQARIETKIAAVASYVERTDVFGATGSVGYYFDTFRINPQSIPVLLTLLHEKPLEIQNVVKDLQEKPFLGFVESVINMVNEDEKLNRYIKDNPEHITDIIKGYLASNPATYSAFIQGYGMKMDTLDIVSILLTDTEKTQKVLSAINAQDPEVQIAGLRAIFNLLGENEELRKFLINNGSVLDEIVSTVVGKMPDVKDQFNAYLGDTKLSDVVNAMVADPEGIKRFGNSIADAIVSYRSGDYLGLIKGGINAAYATPSAIIGEVGAYAKRYIYGREVEFADLVNNIATSARNSGERDFYKVIVNQSGIENVDHKKYLLKKSLDNTTFQGTDLSKLDIHKFSLQNSKLDRTDFTGTNIDQVDFKGSNFVDVDFSEAVITRSSFQGVKFQSLKFNNTVIDGESFSSLMAAAKADFRRIDIAGLKIASVEDLDLINAVNIQKAEFMGLTPEQKQDIAFYTLASEISARLFTAGDRNRFEDSKMIYNVLREKADKIKISEFFIQEDMNQGKFVLGELGAGFIEKASFSFKEQGSSLTVTGGISLNSDKVKKHVKPDLDCILTGVIAERSFEGARLQSLRLAGLEIDSKSFTNLMAEAKQQSLRLDISGLKIKDPLELNLINAVNIQKAEFIGLTPEQKQDIAFYMLASEISANLFTADDRNRVADSGMIFNALKEAGGSVEISDFFDKESFGKGKFILNDKGSALVEDMTASFRNKASSYTLAGLATGGIFLREDSIESQVKPDLNYILTKRPLAELIAEELGQRIFGTTEGESVDVLNEHLRSTQLLDQLVYPTSDLIEEIYKLLAETNLHTEYYNQTKRGWNMSLYMPKDIISNKAFTDTVKEQIQSHAHIYSISGPNQSNSMVSSISD